MSERRDNQRGTLLHPDNTFGRMWDGMMMPLREGIGEALGRIPMIGQPLAALTDGILNIFQSSVGLLNSIAWFIPGRILNYAGRKFTGSDSVLSDLPAADYTKNAEEEKEKDVTEEKTAEKTVEADEIEREADLDQLDQNLIKDDTEIPDFDNLSDVLKSDKAPTAEELASMQENNNEVKTSEALQRDSHYAGGNVNIFKKSADDVYAPGEDEPQLKAFINRVNYFDNTKKEWVGALKKSSVDGKKPFTDEDFEAMAEGIYAKTLDQKMRRERQAAGKPNEQAKQELHLRNRSRTNKNTDPFALEKAAKAELVRKLKLMQATNPEQLKKLLENDRSPEFRKLGTETMKNVSESIRRSDARSKIAQNLSADRQVQANTNVNRRQQPPVINRNQPVV